MKRKSTRIQLHFFLFLLISLTACQRLSVKQRYASYQDLASVSLHTPDPRKKQPLEYSGEQLLISWSLRKDDFKLDETTLCLKVRFANQTQIEQCYPIDKIGGEFVYSCLGEEYREKGGILTYQVSILAQNEVIERWDHQVWASLIEIKEEDDDEE